MVFFVAAAGLAIYAFLPDKSRTYPDILTGIISSEPAAGRTSEMPAADFAAQEQLKRENSDLLNKIRILEIQITEHSKEIEAQRQIIDKHRQSGEQVSKKDFEELQKKIDEEKAARERFKKENAELSERIKAFEIKSAEYEKKIKEQTALIDKEKGKCDGCASKKELEEVKKKLENAEQVLRIVHGAGTETG